MLRRTCRRRTCREVMYPLLRELAAAGARVRVPVAVTCRVLKLARQRYYRWLACLVTNVENAQARLANALYDAHRDDSEFGYRFLVDEAATAGHVMARPHCVAAVLGQPVVEGVRQDPPR